MVYIIMFDVINGNVFRINDFRLDLMVKIGIVVEEDYFFKYL